MKQLFSIAKFTVKENISNKIFNGFVFFGILVIFTTVVLKEISLYESIKVITDTGLFLIEFLILLMAVYLSSTMIIKHKNEKSIYLVLTKPVSRGMYVTGIMLGIIATVMVNIAVMALILFGIIVWQKGTGGIPYFYSVLFIFYKLSIISAIGVLFSIVADSIVTANIFTFSVCIAAHGINEIKMLADKMDNIFYKGILETVYYILPNMRTLNYRDYLKQVEPDMIKITLYVAGYILIVSALSNLIFSKKKI